MTYRRMMTVLTLTVMMMAAGCGSDATPAAAGSKTYTYTVRGEIVQLPSAESVDQQMLIRHEAIPDFINDQGEKVGMMSMTMQFPVGKDVSLEGLAVGDAISFTFDLDWSGTPPYKVVKIEKLAAGTELNFGKPMHDMSQHMAH